MYTTLNIQHLESLNDIVAQITGIIVHETVPDSVIDEANEIELVDLPPDELLQRLKDGKVYVPEQAARAIEQFFRKGNLTALRELSLRRTAARVDDQMRAYMETRAIAGPWAANERLLVCVSPGALSERLVRTARRLADELKAEWCALYVETPDHARLSTNQRERITRILGLAEDLGAQVLTLPSPAVAETVLHYARTHNITKIIPGKPLRSRFWEFLHGSVVDQIIRQSGTIDVYVISGETESSPIIATDPWQPHRPLRRYFQSLLLVVGATLLGMPVRELVSPINLVMLYLLTVVAAAIYLGRGPSLMAAVLGVLAFDFFFVPPTLTFAVTDTQYILTFVGLLVVGLVISDLTVRLREQVEVVQRRESETMELYEFSRDLTAAAGLEDILQSAIKHISQTFDRQAGILLPEGEELKLPRGKSALSTRRQRARGRHLGFSTQRASGPRLGYASRRPDPLPPSQNGARRRRRACRQADAARRSIDAGATPFARSVREPDRARGRAHPTGRAGAPSAIAQSHRETSDRAFGFRFTRTAHAPRFDYRRAE